MFAKHSLILLLVAVIVVSTHHDHRSSNSEEHPPLHNHGRLHKHDKSNEHQYHGEAQTMADVKVDQESPFVKTKNLTEDLYTEIFVIGSGDNYLSAELPDDVHVNARAIVLTSQKLHSMEKVYSILASLTTDYALKGVKLEDKQTAIDLVNDVTAQVRSQCPEFDHIKNNLKDSFIARGKLFKSGGTRQEKTGQYDAWLWEPFARLASMNKQVYSVVSHKDDKPEYRILQAMAKKAVRKEPGAEKLEQMYTVAMAKTAEKISPAHDLARRAQYIFFHHIVQQLAEDATLFVSLYGDNKFIDLINRPF